MKKIIFSALISAISLGAFASGDDSKPADNIDVRLGWSVGGTMPIGMPASIRSLESYNLKPNFQVAADYEYRFTEHLGVEAGLKLEYKGLKTDAGVKAYQMSMVKDGEEISGYFTGNVVTDTWMLQAAVPVQFAYRFNDKVKVKAGPYVALGILDRFEGYAYDGYLRQNTPTGAKINLGSSVEERGSYDFRDDMRPVTWGIDLGVDWYAWQNIGLYADLSWGTQSVFKSSFTTIEQSMYPIYGTVGVVFNINK